MTATISHSLPLSIAIIPARIGSQRIPQKNIRQFHGKPIIQYPIEAAKNCGIFDRIVVSTDSDKVCHIAAAAGALTYKRDPALGTDKSGMFKVIQEVLVHFHSVGDLYDYVCMIYPCAPFLTAERLQQGYEHMRKGCEFALPMYKTPPPERSLYDAHGSMRPRFPYEFNTESNNWPDTYHPAEGWWWATAVALEIHQGFWGERNKGVLVPQAEVQAIDTEEDWRDAEERYGRGG